LEAYAGRYSDVVFAQFERDRVLLGLNGREIGVICQNEELILIFDAMAHRLNRANYLASEIVQTDGDSVRLYSR